MNWSRFIKPRSKYTRRVSGNVFDIEKVLIKLSKKQKQLYWDRINLLVHDSR